jgi:hypothetical protein
MFLLLLLLLTLDVADYEADVVLLLAHVVLLLASRKTL